MAKNDKNNKNANRVANKIRNYVKQLNYDLTDIEQTNDIYDIDYDYIYLQQVQKNTKERKWNVR